MVEPVSEVHPSQKVVGAIAGERRQVTAVFYDIVGSTQLLQKLDPEDFAFLQRRLHSQAATIIRDNGGYFGNLQGDGGSAYFGLPVSSEDAAECAVSSAFELISQCQVLSRETDLGAALQIRVGIATGTVIVSDVEDQSLPARKEIIGIAPNLAARIQSEAEPNSVIVSDATYRLTRGAFEFQSIGTRQLKGFADAVALWKPTARRLQRDRFSSSHGTLTPLVGRADELDLCRRKWTEARDGRGQVLVMAGEAGIGKSRLAAELNQEVSRSGYGSQVFQCLPRGNSRPLHPFIDALRREIRRDTLGPPGLEPKELRAFLQASGAKVSEDAINAAAFLSGGSNAQDADQRASGLSVDEASSQAIDSIVEILIAWSSGKPLLIIIEDLHWADTFTRAMIAELPARIAKEPILAVLTTRQPADLADLFDNPDVPTIVLSGLGAQETPQLLEALWIGAPPPGLASFIHDRSEGVPLFAEELAGLFKERFGDGGSNPKDWNRALQESGVVSLKDILSARLSDLGKARRVAQVASVIGREFKADLLLRLLEEETTELSLNDALTQLRRSGIIRRHGDNNDAVYRFRHVLLQEAAYESLLKSDRRELHRRVAELVIQGTVSAPPDEVVAWHCGQAGRPLEAAFYAMRAAEACAVRSAPREAEQLLALTEGYIAECGADAEVDEIALQLLAMRGPIAIAVSGKGSPEARAIYEEGVAICRQREVKDRERWFPLYWGWWYTSPDRTTKRIRSQVLINDLDQANDPEIRLQTLHCAWAANFHAGQHHLCMNCIDKGLKLYDPDRGRVSRIRYGGHDAKVCGLGERAQLLWLTGDADGANEGIRQALEWAESIDHLGSLCHALDNAILLSTYQRDVPKTLELARRLRDLADVHDFPEVRAKSRIFAGWALALQGSLAEGLREFEAGLQTQQAIGTDEDAPVYSSLWAELLVRMGRSEPARLVLSGAIEEAEATGNMVWLPELYRLRALTRESDELRASVLDLERAAALAEGQGAATLAARARAELDRFRHLGRT